MKTILRAGGAFTCSVVTLALLIGIFAGVKTAQAAWPVVVDTPESCFTYINNGNGTATLTGFDEVACPLTNITIPLTIGGLNVAEVGNYFMYNQMPIITNLTIKPCLTRMGDMAFGYNQTIANTITELTVVTFECDHIAGLTTGYGPFGNKREMYIVVPDGAADEYAEKFRNYTMFFPTATDPGVVHIGYVGGPDYTPGTQREYVIDRGDVVDLAAGYWFDAKYTMRSSDVDQFYIDWFPAVSPLLVPNLPTTWYRNGVAVGAGYDMSTAEDGVYYAVVDGVRLPNIIIRFIDISGEITSSIVPGVPNTGER